jgi:hypothetical protein
VHGNEETDVHPDFGAPASLCFHLPAGRKQKSRVDTILRGDYRSKEA